jgi:hypothetical protein
MHRPPGEPQPLFTAAKEGPFARRGTNSHPWGVSAAAAVVYYVVECERRQECTSAARPCLGAIGEDMGV